MYKSNDAERNVAQLKTFSTYILTFILSFWSLFGIFSEELCNCQGTTSLKLPLTNKVH